MKKCVEILIEYLATKQNNLNTQFGLALQWCRLVQMNTASVSSSSAAAAAPLNRQQINSLFESILKHVIAAASTYAKLANQKEAKTAKFGEFFLNLYELFEACKIPLRQSSHFSIYLDMMITCYRLLYKNENPYAVLPAINDVDSYNDEFQRALDLGARKTSEKTKKKSQKASNKNTQPVQDEN